MTLDQKCQGRVIISNSPPHAHTCPAEVINGYQITFSYVHTTNYLGDHWKKR